MQNHLSRVFFLSKGCKQVPLEYTKNIVRWAHPDGYFLNAQGQKVAHNFSPTHQQGTKSYTHGVKYPILRECVRECHILMALAFYGDRPTDPTTGKVCVCHHLIPDALDYKPANLLCWLTRAEHIEADRRQRALRKVLPDMHDLSYEEHRRLQDPRQTGEMAFALELNRLVLVFNRLDS